MVYCLLRMGGKECDSLGCKGILLTGPKRDGGVAKMETKGVVAARLRNI